MTIKDKLDLWRKVKHLASQNCTKSQISAVLGITTRTVTRYLKFENEAEVEEYFSNSLSRTSPQRDFLKLHDRFFIEQIKHPARFSNAQIMDHYKENYPDAPEVSETTLRRFLEDLRKREGVHKLSRRMRVFRRRDPKGPGIEAQVDFGEGYIYDRLGNRHPYHFFLLVLSYSCRMFAYFIEDKFDAKHAVYALHKAFEYMRGVPEWVVMDRDTVFYSGQEGAEIKKTKELQAFISKANFKADFCHARDPQSKGRVEKYVSYVKDNFLNGREFKDYETLNRECLEWLRRTGNAHKHDATGYSPEYLYHHEERQALREYNCEMEDPDWQPREYKVRRDNTIMYEGRNMLDVPPGTYKGEGTRVLVDDRTNAEKLIIMDIHRKTLVEYPKNALGKNIHIPLPDEMLKEVGMNKHERMLRTIIDSWETNDHLSLLLKSMRERQGERYYKKGFMLFYELVKNIEPHSLWRLIKHCAEHNKTRLEEIKGAMDLLHIQPWVPPVGDGHGVVLGNYDFSDYGDTPQNKGSFDFNVYNFDNRNSEDKGSSHRDPEDDDLLLTT